MGMFSIVSLINLEEFFKEIKINFVYEPKNWGQRGAQDFSPFLMCVHFTEHLNKSYIKKVCYKVCSFKINKSQGYFH